MKLKDLVEVIEINQIVDVTVPGLGRFEFAEGINEMRRNFFIEVFGYYEIALLYSEEADEITIELALKTEKKEGE